MSISFYKQKKKKKSALKIQDKFVMDWVNAKSMAQSVTNLPWIFSALFGSFGILPNEPM